MRILLGPGLYDPKGNEAYLVKAIKKMAETIVFNGSFVSLEQLLSRLPYGWEPDFIVIRDAEYYKMPSNLEESPYPVVGLVGDYNLTLNKMLPILSSFDYFFCDTKGVRIFNKLGFDNCEFFCLYGYDPEVHRPYYRYEDKQIDIIFIGNLNRLVQQTREEYLYKLARLGNRYKIKIITGVFGADFARMLSRAKLVFNRSIRDEVNMRFFEAAGCGSIVMNNYIEELNILGFTPNEDYLVYKEPEDAIISFFDRNEKERAEVMLENIKSKLRFHSYDARAESLIERLRKLNFDASRRRMLGIPKKDRIKRWQLYRSDIIQFREKQWDIFHPQIVAWAKHLVDNELEVKNFDTDMWFWWIELLKNSGLEGYASYFIKDRLELLSSVDFYHNVKNELEGYLL